MTLTEKVKDFAEHSTMHGMNRVALSKPVGLRACWALVVLTTCTFCVVQVYFLFGMYFQRLVTIQRQVIYEAVEFPAVSFCNLNPIRKSKITLGDVVRLNDSLQNFDNTVTSQIQGGNSRRRKRRSMPANDFDFSNKYLKLDDALFDMTSQQQNATIKGGSQIRTMSYLYYDEEKAGVPALPRMDKYGRETVNKRDNHDKSKQMSRKHGLRHRRNAQNISTTYDDQCFSTISGFDYKGTLNNTVSGRTCQRWDSQYPHTHGYITPSEFPDDSMREAENYCRNPKRNPGTSPWCYTADVDTRWEYCDLDFCTVDVDKSCFIGPTGENYMGFYNVTQSGRVCQRWDSNHPHVHKYNESSMFPDDTIADTENYCRNPEGDSGIAPWCYTSDAGVRWEYCGIPLCNKEDGYDPIDNEYQPISDLDDFPWFERSRDEEISDVLNNVALASALYDLDISIRREMGHQLNDLVQECSWNGMFCSPLNFTGFMSRKYGNCYTFNSGSHTQKLYQTRPGQLYGLSLNLFIERNEYIDSIATTRGARVLIHGQDQHPFMADEGVNVNVGSRTSIKIRKTVFARLGDPFSNCTTGEGFDLLYRKKYSVMACKKSCHQREIIARCRCADSMLPVPANRAVCRSEQERQCQTRVELDIAENKIVCYCPSLCDDKQFRQSMYVSNWPSGSRSNILLNNYRERSDALRKALVTRESISDNLLKLDVFYDELKYDSVVEQEAYSSSKLLGDIGGQLGLWIGISALTFLEILQFFFELCILCCKRKDSDRP